MGAARAARVSSISWGDLGGREVGWVGIGEAVEAGLNDDGPELIEALGDGINALV